MSTPHPDSHDHEACRRYLSTLSDYADGTLSDDLCQELEAHMATCENCRIVVNTLSKTIMLYRQMPEPEIPHAVEERLYKVLNLQDYYMSPGENTAP